MRMERSGMEEWRKDRKREKRREQRRKESRKENKAKGKQAKIAKVVPESSEKVEQSSPVKLLLSTTVSRTFE